MEQSDTVPDLVAARSAEIVDAVGVAVADLVGASPVWLQEEHGRAQALRARVLERASRLAANGEPFADDDLRFFREIGRQFARHAMPRDSLTQLFDVGMAAVIRELWRIGPAERFVETVRFTERAAALMEQGRRMSIRGYLEGSRSAGDRRWMRRAVAEALIGGESVPPVGEPLASSYLVLVCAVPAHETVAAAQRDAVARAIECLPGALCCGELSRLVVLLPAGASAEDAATTAAELVGRLSSLTGRAVRAARAYRPEPAGVPAAYAEAREVHDLVGAIPDAVSRPYRSDELLVELAIARQPDIARRLAALLAPLEAGSDLRRTVEVLLACDLDRERAARELHIHRRTLRYRMVRIRELSGIDLDTGHGLQLIRAALTAAHLVLPAPPSAARTTPGGRRAAG